MGAMKEIYTETQDLQSAARELDEESFVEYTEAMGWVSSTEMDAYRRNLIEAIGKATAISFLADPTVAHPSTGAVGGLMKKVQEIFKIEKREVIEAMKKSVPEVAAAALTGDVHA